MVCQCTSFVLTTEVPPSWRRTYNNQRNSLETEATVTTKAKILMFMMAPYRKFFKNVLRMKFLKIMTHS
jgi:hypothetical protein